MRMKLDPKSALLGAALVISGAFAADQAPSLISFVFQPGTPIKASEVNANFAALGQPITTARLADGSVTAPKLATPAPGKTGDALTIATDGTLAWIPAGSGPQGPVGPQGPKGDTGAVGPMGLTGPQGATGNAGPAGPKGDTGATGLQGLTGATGDGGAVGPQGLKGDTGSTGPMGMSGPMGPMGLTGPAGPQGLKGDPGAVGATGPAGAVGPAGPQGTKGDTGATGATGPQGAAGPQGLKGDTGATGAPGPVGATGPIGPAGPSGSIGATGATGATGPMGPQGPMGPSGTATLLGEPTGFTMGDGNSGAECTLGEVSLTAATFAATGGGMAADGRLLPINQYSALFSLLGTMYGGDGRTTFALPDLRDAAPKSRYGGNVHYIICTQGYYPTRY
jgi:hypothetical protein